MKHFSSVISKNNISYLNIEKISYDARINSGNIISFKFKRKLVHYHFIILHIYLYFKDINVYVS